MNKISSYTQQCPVTFGVDAITTIGQEMEKAGVKKLFVIYDQGVKVSGLAEKVTRLLDEQKIAYVPYDDIRAEPVEDVVDLAYQTAKEAGCDSVMGLGGGSPMDTAKIVSVLLKKGGCTRDWSLRNGLIWHEHVPSFMVPTTSGTGSEVTCVAVFSRVDHDKDGVLCGPTAAIVDPAMTVTCPPLQTVTSGFDAMAHAAEAYFSLNPDPLSDLMALEAVRLIMANVRAAYRNGSDMDARVNMALASNLAGMAFSNTGVAFGHAAGHEFGTVFHMPHGLACGYSLPVTLKWNAVNNTQRARELAKAMGIADCETMPAGDLGQAAARIILDIQKECSVPNMAEKGATREACIALAEASIEHNQLQFHNNVREIPIEEYREMLAEMFDLSVNG